MKDMTSVREVRSLKDVAIDTSASGEEPALRLLALDSGGIRGLSELLIVKEIMQLLRTEENERRALEGNEPLKDLPKPCNYFDIIGGSGTGGVVALMLGRLRMDVDRAIQCYIRFAKDTFSKPKRSEWSGAFSSKKFEAAARLMVKEELGDPETPWLEKGDGPVCRTFVCAQNEYNAKIPILLRTYESQETHIGCTVWQAARATCAVPAIFKSVQIGQKQPYIGGGVGVNNPASMLLEEAKVLFPSRSIACLISIGAIHKDSLQVTRRRFFQHTIPMSVANTVITIATDCERTHQEMRTRFAAFPNTYFRLKLDRNVDLSESENLSEIEAYTMQYTRSSAGEMFPVLAKKMSVPEGTFSLEQFVSVHPTLSLSSREEDRKKGDTEKPGAGKEFASALRRWKDAEEMKDAVQPSQAYKISTATSTTSTPTFSLPFKAWDIDDRVSSFHPSSGLSLSIPFIQVELDTDIAWVLQQIQDAIGSVTVRANDNAVSSLDSAKLQTQVIIESLMGNEIPRERKEDLKSVNMKIARLYLLSEWVRSSTSSSSLSEEELLAEADEIAQNLTKTLMDFSSTFTKDRAVEAGPSLKSCIDQLADVQKQYINYLTDYNDSLSKGTVKEALAQADKALEQASQDRTSLMEMKHLLRPPTSESGLVG